MIPRLSRNSRCSFKSFLGALREAGVRLEDHLLWLLPAACLLGALLAWVVPRESPQAKVSCPPKGEAHQFRLTSKPEGLRT